MSIREWVSSRQNYCNPIFALLLLVNVFVFPSYRSAARVQEPVQPMAQTAEQVVDAMHAVQVGVPVDDAFGVRPLPYRDTVKYWGSLYLDLFDENLPVGGDSYLVDEEIGPTDVGFVFEGETLGGKLYNIEFYNLHAVSLNSGDLSDEVVAGLQGLETSLLVGIAKLNTFIGEQYAWVSIVQADNGEVRQREVVPLLSLSEEEFDELQDWERALVHDIGDPVDPCHSCTASAYNGYQLAKDIADIALTTALGGATLAMVGRGFLCLGLAAIPAFGAGAAVSCIIRAALQSTAAAVVAVSAYQVAMRTARALLRHNLEECYIQFPGCRPV